MDAEAETLDAPSVLEPISVSRRTFPGAQQNFDEVSRLTDIGVAPVASPMVLDSSYDRKKRGVRRVTRSLPPPRSPPAFREPNNAAPVAPFACLNCFAPGSLISDDDDEADFEFDADVSRSSVGSLGVLCAPGFLRPSIDGEPRGEDVTLNVYRFTRLSAFEWMEKYGLGIYHSAVMVRGIEYTFEAMGGVHVSKPHSAPGCVVVDQVLVGHTDYAPDEIEDIVDALLPLFTPATYNKLTRNCHHFSEELCRRLTARSIPGWVNRAANVGNAIGLRDRRKEPPPTSGDDAPPARPRPPPPPVELTVERRRSASDLAQRSDGMVATGVLRESFSDTNDSPRTPPRTPPRTSPGGSPRRRRATISFAPTATVSL